MLIYEPLFLCSQNMDQGKRSLLDLAKRSNILDDENVRKLVLAAGLSDNRSLRGSAAKAVLGRSVQQYRYPFGGYDVYGDIYLGMSFRNRFFHLSEDDLSKHLLAVGQSGSGKTTLFYSLMDEVDKPFWAFDLKQDYRHLVQDLDLLVLPWTRFRFNPLKPPEGVPPRRWAQVFTEIFGHATGAVA
jgi:hypothetical protein